MPRKFAREIMREAIDRRIREMEGIKDPPIRPSITVTRSTGSGAISIASQLAEYLDGLRRPDDPPWSVLDRDLVNRVLEDHNLPQQMALYFPEDEFSVLKDLVGEVLGLHPSNWTLLQKTTITVRRLCRMGHVIIVGRGASIMAEGIPYVVNVRLVGAFENRIKRVMVEQGMNRTEAAAHINEADRAREAFVKQHFHRTLDDPLLYHMVLNTDRLKDQEVLSLVSEAIRRVVTRG